MAEKLDFDLSGERLYNLAERMVDEHNYIGALKMLNKNAEENGNDEFFYMLYAEIYDDLGLFEKSVNNWFAFLDTTRSDDLSECYEGLAIGYMNLGNEHFSAYYYNKLLSECEDVDSDTREEILGEFMSAEENPLKFVYPPALADFTKVMSDGIELMKAGEYDRAVQIFEEVDEGNEKYAAARNHIAMCKIITDKIDEAEEECLKLLKTHPDDVNALSTLAAVRTDAGDKEGAINLAKRLLALNTDDEGEIYKIATVCCENGMHEEAYELFCKLTGEFSYDKNIMYFKAVAAFNCGKYEQSFQSFDSLAAVYPEAVTAAFYYKAARDMVREDKISELSYFYRLPQALRESSLKVMAAFLRLGERASEKFAGKVDLSQCVKWCFDEYEGANAVELQTLAVQVAVKAYLDDLVRAILLDAFLPDKLKLDIIASLAERNEINEFGLVICNVYKKVTTHTLLIDRKKRKNFVQAYARLVAHFSILDDSLGETFAAVAEMLYVKLKNENRLDAAADTSALCAALYKCSGVVEAGITEEKIEEFFDVSWDRINKILGEI